MLSINATLTHWPPTSTWQRRGRCKCRQVQSSDCSGLQASPSPTPPRCRGAGCLHQPWSPQSWHPPLCPQHQLEPNASLRVGNKTCVTTGRQYGDRWKTHLVLSTIDVYGFFFIWGTHKLFFTSKHFCIEVIFRRKIPLSKCSADITPSSYTRCQHKTSMCCQTMNFLRLLKTHYPLLIQLRH